MTDDLVVVDSSGAVCTLTLDSPHNRNALSSALLDQLVTAFRGATSDRSTRAIVLTGTGSVFSSGADLSERGEFRSARMEELLALISSAPVPVMARVNGHARAGGIGLIAASDLAVGLAASTFGFSEVRLGVAPALIMVPALRKMPRRFLERTMLTGASFTGAEAAAAGLLTAAVDDVAALDAWVGATTTDILKSAPGAVAATKQLLHAVPDLDFADALALAGAKSAELFNGEEAAEGMEAFFAKRPPAWDEIAESTGNAP
ncbi:MAG TPA: enoyl-CoA hydratase-related protein [Acidimicrobiales bacterium]